MAPQFNAKKPRTIDQLGSSIGDEANLTDQELQDRLDEYLGNQKTTKAGVDTTRLGQEITSILSSNGVPQEEINGAVKMITDQAAAGGHITYLPDGEIVNGQNSDNAKLGGIAGTAVMPGTGTAVGAGIGSAFGGGTTRNATLNNTARILAPIMPLINAKIEQGAYKTGYSAEDLNPDVKRIKDLQGTRTAEAYQNNQLDNLVNQYPQELAKGTNDVIQAQAAQGRSFFDNQLAPEIGQTANARGTLFGGDYQNELARGASGVQGTLETNAVNLQAQDQQFFADLAYQNTLRKAITAGQDVTSQIANQRNQTEAQKNQGFQSSQADINNSFQSQLYNQQNARALANQNALLRNQQAQKNKANQAQLIGGIGSAIGGVAGAFAGGPVGAAAGAQAGGAAGGVVGG